MENDGEIVKSDALADEVLQFVIAVQTIVIEFANKNIIKPNDSKSFYLLQLFYRLISLYDACITLVEKNSFAGIPILHRSFLEAYVDLINTYKQGETYIQKIYISCLKEDYDHLELAIEHNNSSNKNPYYDATAAHPELFKKCQEMDKELEDWKRKGIQPLNRYARFKAADLVILYKGVYSELSSHAHNGLRPLDSFHTEENGTNFQMVLKKETFDIEKFVSPLAGLLANACILIQQHFSIADDQIMTLKALLQENKKGIEI